MPELQLHSIQIGRVRSMTPGSAESPELDRQPWTSAIIKTAIDGPVHVTATGLIGDAQADRKHHGGAEMALLAYGAANYWRWREEIGAMFPPGGFGENLTVDGANEDDVCIGDIWRIGPNVRVQVSQPREPCWKLARRWGMPDLVQRVHESGRSGWYLRVFEEGEIEAGQAITLEDRPEPGLTIRAVSETWRAKEPSAEALQRLAQCCTLSPGWREQAAQRLAKLGAT